VRVVVGTFSRRDHPVGGLRPRVDGFTARRFVDLSRTKSMICRASSTPWR
jgi:hypothetical protein